jgi:hypothetical protein
LAEVITLKKRLLGKEDINFDIIGNGETENFFSPEGEQYKITKLNASHIPLTAHTREKTASGNVDLALSNFADKINNFVASDVLTENLTIIFEAEDSAETIQDKINIQKKNLNGYTLTFVFPAQLSQNLYSTFEWKDFYNGSIIITGGTASSKIAIYDQVNTGSLFRFYRCQCEVIVQYFYFVHQYSQYAISAESTSALIVQDCNFSGIPNVDSYAVNKYVSNVVLTNCEFYEDMEYYPVEKQESATGKYIGEIFAYPAAEPPEGAYLLNGQTIYNCKELYPDFWAWLQEEIADGYMRAITAVEYENAIAQYGICGAFVVSENDVRLPLYNNAFLQAGDSSNIGTEVESGLPNITGTFVFSGTDNWSSATGAFTNTQQSGAGQGHNSGTTGGVVFNLDASLSNDTYGKPDTVQPLSIRVSYCIQVFNAATELSTQESAQLASQMQMKAQTDLANVSNPVQAFKDMAIDWGMPDYTAGVDITSSLTTANSEYTVPYDCFITFATFIGGYGYIFTKSGCYGANTNSVAYNLVGISAPANGDAITDNLYLPKGMKIYTAVNNGNNWFVMLYPLKGADR